MTKANYFALNMHFVFCYRIPGGNGESEPGTNNVCDGHLPSAVTGENYYRNCCKLNHALNKYGSYSKNIIGNQVVPIFY